MPYDKKAHAKLGVFNTCLLVKPRIDRQANMLVRITKP